MKEFSSITHLNTGGNKDHRKAWVKLRPGNSEQRNQDN